MLANFISIFNFSLNKFDFVFFSKFKRVQTFDETRSSQKWQWPDIVCQLAPFITDLNIGISIITLTLLSIFRSYAVSYPLKNKKCSLTKKTCAIIIVIIWISCGLMSSFFLFTNNVNFSNFYSTKNTALPALIRFK